MRRADWQPAFDRLLPFVEDAARSQYQAARLDDGFRFWAVGQVLTDTGLSDNELIDAIRMDSGSDLGLDGFYEDSESETLFLFQSRFHSAPTTIGNDELSAFLASLRKILNAEVVLAAAGRNPVVQDAHKAVTDAIDAGWTLAFIFVGSGYLSPEGARYAEEFRLQTLNIDSVQIKRN